jgi:FAD:protein FMN transferase
LRGTHRHRLAAARACAAALACAFALIGCSTQPALTTLRGPTMGTTWSVKLVVPAQRSADVLQRGIQREVDTVVAQMSTYEADSDLGRYNRAPAGTWQGLPPEFFGVLDYALELARDTHGAYDPTVGPLVDLWGFGPGAHRHEVPSDAAIAAARARVGYARILLDRPAHRALQPGDVHLDLSSVGKGFGTDQIARYLEREGVEDYLVDISGELRAHGARPGGGDWEVGIERPGAAAGAVDTPDQVARIVRLRGQSIATSGDYRHFFEDAGPIRTTSIRAPDIPWRIASRPSPPSPTTACAPIRSVPRSWCSAKKPAWPGRASAASPYSCSFAKATASSSARRPHSMR